MEQTQIEEAFLNSEKLIKCILILFFHFDPEASKDIDHLKHENTIFKISNER